MNFLKPLATDRLHLMPLANDDALFIQQLLNTAGWIAFIGDRNIHSPADALAYIERINNNPAINYWTVQLKVSNISIGLVTLIQRDYLTQPDIGFAFLPEYNSKGHAYEAAKVVLAHVWQDDNITCVYAVTLPANNKSIQLLTKLGLTYEKLIVVNNDALQVYSVKKQVN